MDLNQKLLQIKGSPTLAMNDRAQRLIKAGKDLIHLGIGEPLNDCPPAAVHRAAQKLNTGQVKYSPTGGLGDLKQGVIDYTKKFYGRAPDPEQILITVGAKQSLANALAALLNPGEEVVLLAPYWVSYPAMIQLAGAKPVPVDPPPDLIPSLDLIKAAVTPSTRAVIVNSPNNPSGVVYPPELIAALVDYCETEGIYLILDDIYHRLVFPGSEWVPGYVFTNRSVEDSRLIIVNGISKTYGMTGFRVGWTIGPTALIKAMKTIQGHTTSGVSSVLQEGALGALESGEDTVAELKQLIAGNRTILLEGLRSIPEVRIPEPGGAFYCFPDFSAYQPRSTDLANFLLDKAYTVTVPGSAFGREGHLRLSYSAPPEQVAESVERIRWVLDPAAPKTISIGGEEFTRTWNSLEEVETLE
jgi:aspartate aminotransferase